MTFYRCSGVWCRLVVRAEAAVCPRCGLPMLAYRPPWFEAQLSLLAQAEAGA